MPPREDINAPDMYIPGKIQIVGVQRLFIKMLF